MMGLNMEPLLQAWSCFWRRKLQRCAQLCSDVLEGSPYDQLMCSSVQKALFEEEDRVKKLQQKMAALEKRNKQLKDRVKKVKRSLRQTRKHNRHMEQMNKKLNERLSSIANQTPHLNSLTQGSLRSKYVRV